MSIRMIPKVKELKLISIYLYICDIFDSKLRSACERFSNNNNPDFTDQEVITIYLYAMNIEQRLKIKQIHSFAKDYLRSWFPRLHSYETFNIRVNRLSEAFKHLSGTLLSDYCLSDCHPDTSLVDSLPIITCSGKRPNAVAKELTDKGFCSTKSMYYYGSKLHALAFSRPGHLPFPESLIVTPASENDLNVQKQYWSNFYNRTFYGDKIYNDEDFFLRMNRANNSRMMIPIKAVKGQSQTIFKKIKLLTTCIQLQYQGSANLSKPYSIGS